MLNTNVYKIRILTSGNQIVTPKWYTKTGCLIQLDVHSPTGTVYEEGFLINHLETEETRYLQQRRCCTVTYL